MLVVAWNVIQFLVLFVDGYEVSKSAHLGDVSEAQSSTYLSSKNTTPTITTYSVLSSKT